MTVTTIDPAPGKAVQSIAHSQPKPRPLIRNQASYLRTRSQCVSSLPPSARQSSTLVLSFEQGALINLRGSRMPHPRNRALMNISSFLGSHWHLSPFIQSLIVFVICKNEIRLCPCSLRCCGTSLGLSGKHYCHCRSGWQYLHSSYHCLPI